MRLLAVLIVLLCTLVAPTPAVAQPGPIGCASDVQPQGRITLHGRRYNVYVTLTRWIPGVPPPEGQEIRPWVTTSVILIAANGQPVPGNIPTPIAVYHFLRDRWRPHLEPMAQTGNQLGCSVGFGARGDIDWPDGSNATVRLAFRAGFLRWRTISVPVQLNTIALP